MAKRVKENSEKDQDQDRQIEDILKVVEGLQIAQNVSRSVVAPTGDTDRLNERVRIKEMLTQHFTVDQIKSLAWDIDIADDINKSGTKETIIESLLSEARNRRRMLHLFARLKDLRPFIEWSIAKDWSIQT